MERTVHFAATIPTAISASLDFTPALILQLVCLAIFQIVTNVQIALPALSVQLTMLSMIYYFVITSVKQVYIIANIDIFYLLIVKYIKIIIPLYKKIIKKKDLGYYC